jgi:hypothetical protein
MTRITTIVVVVLPLQSTRTRKSTTATATNIVRILLLAVLPLTTIIFIITIIIRIRIRMRVVDIPWDVWHDNVMSENCYSIRTGRNPHLVIMMDVRTRHVPTITTGLMVDHEAGYWADGRHLLVVSFLSQFQSPPPPYFFIPVTLGVESRTY